MALEREILLLRSVVCSDPRQGGSPAEEAPFGGCFGGALEVLAGHELLGPVPSEAPGMITS